MSNTAADYDVLEAFSNRWNAAPAAFVNSFLGGFWAGRVVAQDAQDNPTPMPYVSARSQKAKDPEYSSYIGDGTDSYIDFRRVTLEIRGVGQDRVSILAESVKALFDRKRFAMPRPNASLMACLAMGDTKLEPDPVAKDGEDVWVATIEFEVTTSRAVAF